MKRKAQGNLFFPSFFLAAAALIAYLPLFFHSMKYDILDQYLPWRYLVSECLHNGILPVWNPYTHLGYPLHADPQSGAWYPFVWIASLFTRYNIYTIHIEYIFHAWLGGIGMFLLTRLFTGDRNVSLLAAAGYMLSGFFTGNAQHLTWIISAAWVPFIFFYFIRMGMKEGWRDCLLFALSFFMLLSGGYPAFTIVLIYILLVLALLIIFVKWRKKQRNSVFMLRLFVSAVAVTAMSAGMIYSLTESFAIAGRAGGLSRDAAMANPFSPQCLLSFLFPLPSVSNSTFFDTDISMSNAFFGLFLFSGLLFSLVKKKSLTEWLILAGSVFFLLCAMGSYTPVRGLLYDYLPLMNIFRMPSLFRLFMMMGFILLAAIALKESYRDREKMVSMFKSLTVIYVIAVIAAIATGDIHHLIPERYITWPQKMSFSATIVAQGVLYILFLIAVMPLVRKVHTLYIFIADLIIAAWLCAPVTMVSHVKLKEVDSLTAIVPKNFPVPALTPMIQNADRTNTIGPLWCNLGIWKKQPVFDGYNNFQTRQYLAFESSPVFRQTLKNPLLYITWPEHSGGFSNADSMHIYNDSSWIYASDLPATAIDSLPGSQHLTLSKFTPGYAVALVELSRPAFLTLQQQFDKHWIAKAGRKNLKIYKSNGNNLSVLLPPGKHRVSFFYRNNAVLYALQVTALSIAVILIILLKISFTRARKIWP